MCSLAYKNLLLSVDYGWSVVNRLVILAPPLVGKEPHPKSQALPLMLASRLIVSDTYLGLWWQLNSPHHLQTGRSSPRRTSFVAVSLLWRNRGLAHCCELTNIIPYLILKQTLGAWEGKRTNRWSRPPHVCYEKPQKMVWFCKEATGAMSCSWISPCLSALRFQIYVHINCCCLLLHLYGSL